MKRLVPSAATPICYTDLLKGLYGDHNAFENELKSLLKTKHVFLTGTGTAALYIALLALKKRYPGKHSVVVPAYTAPIVQLAIEKAGLKTVLCDISASTFNMDIRQLPQLLTGDVLCVLPTHLFGIPADLSLVKEIAKKIPVIEDAAQSFGSLIGKDMVGALGDIGILSFQRGKNLSLYSGGALVLRNDDGLADAISILMRSELAPAGWSDAVMSYLKIILVSKVVNPFAYALMHPLVERFKSREIYTTFSLKKITLPQIMVGGSLIKTAAYIAEKRASNGMSLYRALCGLKGITLPELPENAYVAFNQFPIVFHDKEALSAVEKALLRNGIETARQYLKPMNMLFDLGYPPDAFPVAARLAEGLLLLPTHPLVSLSDIDTMAETIKILMSDKGAT